jgi:hypothetical protein
MRSPRHLVTGAFASDETGERYILSLLRDGEVVLKLITTRPDVFAATNHLLDHSDDPEALARQWAPTLPDAVVQVLQLDDLPGASGSKGDDLVIEVDDMHTKNTPRYGPERGLT